MRSSPACYNSRVPDAWDYKVLPKTPTKKWVAEGRFELRTFRTHTGCERMQLVHGKEEKGRKGALSEMLLSNSFPKLKLKIDNEVALGGS